MLWRSPPAPHRVIALVVVALAVPGCAWISRTTGMTTKDQARNQRAAKSVNAQIGAMRFADDFVEESVRATDELAGQVGNARMQIDILEWQLSQANAAKRLKRSQTACPCSLHTSIVTCAISSTRGLSTATQSRHRVNAGTGSRLDYETCGVSNAAAFIPSRALGRARST